jgi:hypothetical protein
MVILWKAAYNIVIDDPSITDGCLGLAVGIIQTQSMDT